ncbi:MAG: hypothetical protein ACR2PZ_14105 [Pseudomonadales bacterium]
MQLSDLGSIGEFLSSIAVLTTLVLLLVELKRNNLIERRQNAKQSARDNGIALQAILAADVSEIFMRGNTEGLGALTDHERYRYDIAYYIWLQTIEAAYADFRKGLYPDESIAPWANSVQGFLSSTGGTAWWEERKFWFSQEFRLDVDRLLASDNPEAAFSGHAQSMD